MEEKEMTQAIAEYRVQVLVETESGAELSRATRDYVEGALTKMFPTARDIRTIITITDDNDGVVMKKFDNNPTKELRERAWVDE